MTIEHQINGILDLKKEETRIVRIEDMNHRIVEMRELLAAASSALRSYQFGNSSPDLAEAIANRIDESLTKQGGTA